MSKYLLDTDSIINFLGGIPTTVRLLENLEEQGDIFCTCDIVIAEVYAGVQPKHREAAGQFLSSLQFLPTSAHAAQQAGAWRYAYAQRGATLPTTDCLIAATAVAHGAALVTGNTKDYPEEELAVLPLPRPEEKGGHAA